MIAIINYGIVELNVDGDMLHYRDAWMSTYDGEFYVVETEEDWHSIDISEAEDKDDMCELVEGFLIHELGCDETWMEI